MKNKKQLLIMSISFVLFFVLSGCNLPGMSQDIPIEELVATYQKQTEAAMGSESPIEEETMAPPEGGSEPSQTATATIALTPTQEKPMVNVSVDTNCRTGPGKIYDWIGGLLVGEEAEVVGASTDGQYWIIRNPDQNGECWLWGNYASVTGETADLPRYTPPPTPTPAFVWEGNWTTYTVDTSDNLIETYPMSISVIGQDFTAIVDMGGGDSATATGTISGDHLSVTGSWVGPINNGPFTFYAMGANQFQGNANNGGGDFGWCGSRGGAGQPSPCFVP
ncbi:MAG: hypothetical protein SVR81_07315 [Chloroflexota bacterium]|nr:hypothetical protein [Chloroflexota bacterium]